ncbi:MAG: hypothetical protein AAF624_07630 [Bacteroidota bacterium]
MIRRQLVERVLRCSKSQFMLLLKKKLYAGVIEVPAWQSNPAREVEGVHEPLTDVATFTRVQARFASTSKKGRYRALVEELTLRGHLRCPQTGSVLLGSASTSRHGYRVWYYHGRGKGAWRMKADEVHTSFRAYLDRLRPSHSVVALARVMCEEAMRGDERAQQRLLERARSEASKAEATLLRADEAYVEGRIDQAAYERLRAKWQPTLTAARVALADAQTSHTGLAERLDFAVELLRDPGRVWDAAGVEARHALVGSTWPSGLVIDGTDCRTLGDNAVSAVFGLESPKNSDAHLGNEAGVLGGSPGRSWGWARIVEIGSESTMW